MTAHNDNTGTRLARIDERTEFMARAIKEIKDELKDIDKKYVTKDQFLPVRNLVYGLASLLLTSIVGAIIALIIE